LTKTADFLKIFSYDLI